MENIFTATKKDFPKIRAIWEERFTTDKTYLNIIFKKILPNCLTFIYKKDQEILSVISMFDVNYFNSKNFSTFSNKITNLGKVTNNCEQPILKGMYLFGVATLTKAEGKKLAIALISHAKAFLLTNNIDFIIEHPANQSLNSYYFKQGFTISIPKINYTIPKLIQYFSISPTLCSPLLLQDIKANFPDRFEWENPKILEALIELGEIESHVESSQNNISNKEETYLALNLLNKSSLNINILSKNFFNSSFFCFPME